MGLAQDILTKFDTAIETTAGDFFQATLTAIYPLVLIMFTLVFIALGINMALNVYQISMRESTQIITRMIVITAFGLTWSNFSLFYGALTSTTDAIASSFFATLWGNENSGGTSAVAMDQFGDQMRGTADGVLQARGSIARGFLGAILSLVLAILLGIYVIIVMFAKLMITVLIGVAPVVAALTMFERTKSVFEAWLSSLAGYLMYPIAAAGVIGTVVGLANSFATDAASAGVIGDTIGFLVLAFVGIVSLAYIPNVASGISGNFSLGNFAPQALKVAGAPLTKLGSMTRNGATEFASGLKSGKTSGLAKYAQQRKLADAGHNLRQKMSAMAKLRPKT